jgi:hypothetical protein
MSTSRSLNSSLASAFCQHALQAGWCCALRERRHDRPRRATRPRNTHAYSIELDAQSATLSPDSTPSVAGPRRCGPSAVERAVVETSIMLDQRRVRVPAPH